MNVNQIRSQVKLMEVTVARIAYQKWSHGMSYTSSKSKSLHIMTSFGGTMGVKSQTICNSPYVLTRSEDTGSVSVLSYLVRLVSS